MVKKFYFRTFENINKYFTQILFVPLLLGGLIQIYNLFRISPECIRFFSASQAISDGLLLLLTLIYSILMIILLLAISIKVRKKQKVEPEGTEERFQFDFEKYSLSKKISYLGLSILAYTMYLAVIPGLFHDQNIKVYVFFLLSFGPIIINALTAYLILSCLFYKSKYFVQDNFEIFLTIYIILTIISSIYSTNQMTNYSLKNFEVLKVKHSCSPRYSGFVEVLYYNDKYIFIRSNCNDKREVIIEKFDALFENTTCP